MFAENSHDLLDFCRNHSLSNNNNFSVSGFILIGCYQNNQLQILFNSTNNVINMWVDKKTFHSLLKSDGNCMKLFMEKRKTLWKLNIHPGCNNVFY